MATDGTRRALLELLVVVVGASIVIAALTGVLVAHFWWSLSGGPSTEQQLDSLVADLADLDGVAAVEGEHVRMGDDTFRDNVFVTVTASSDAGLPRLLQEVSRELAQANGDTRFMAQVVVGELAVGVSPDARLNVARLDLARTLAELPDVRQATVLWNAEGDALVFDDSNSALEVTVQTDAADLAALLETTRLAAAGVTAQGEVTVAGLAGATPRTALYLPDALPSTAGIRSVSSTMPTPVAAEARQTATALAEAAPVVGFALAPVTGHAELALADPAALDEVLAAAPGLRACTLTVLVPAREGWQRDDRFDPSDPPGGCLGAGA